MQYSQKLKIAMEEIKAILKKNDIAGFVVLHTPGFTEYLNHVNPSYSCAKVSEPEGIRVRLRADEVGGKGKAKVIATNTLNMVQHLSLIISKHALIYMYAEEMLNKAWPNDTTPGEETGHTQQNN